MGSKITKIKTPKKDEVHTYIVAGDWHTENLCLSTYKNMIAFAKKIPKESRRLIINGDFLDAPHLMKKDEGFKAAIKSTYGIEETLVPISDNEFEWGNRILDELQQTFGWIYFNAGNHEFRYDWVSSILPHAYRHNFNLQSRLHLRERGIPYVAYNDWLDIGRVSITHGMFHSTSALKQHYEACGARTVIYSHVHKDEHKSFMHRGLTKQAWSCPAMCTLNPEYIKNTDNNWTNGWITLNVHGSGTFNISTQTVWDGRFIDPYGRVYE